MFTESFTAPALDGETITLELDGFTLTATIHRDTDAGPPWENEDGHGPVSDWTRRDKKPGELVLSSDGAAGMKRFYDFAAACRIARAEQWGAAGDDGMTPRQKAAYAARADFQNLKGWANDDWSYVGVAVSVKRKGIALTGPYDFALWGIEESAADHLTETANELAGEALDAARATLADLAA